MTADSQFPPLLATISIVSLTLALMCAIWIAWDCWRRPQHMGIMNLVWPLCALFGSLILLWLYLRHGRASPGNRADGRHEHHHGDTPFHIAVAKGTLHCGSGCTLGDLLAESLAAAAPAVLVPLGYPLLFGERIFATWVLDFLFAFVIGIVFQYFAIAPMRGLRPIEGLKAALKADTLSLIAWQVGMYGLMAIAVFTLYRPLYGVAPDAGSPIFWLTMQAAMIAGFMTAYPMNWWLIRAGIKERM